MESTAPPIRLAGAVLDRHRHVCAFFRTREEAFRILMPFITEGLERGEKMFQITDPALREDHLRRLAEAGVDVAAAQARGQLEVRGWDEAYLRGGRFDQEAMLPLWDELIAGARAAGFPLTRITGPTDWAVGSDAEVEQLLEYEARVNQISARTPDPLVCLYDPAKFSAGAVLDILRTHPLVIIGGVLQENPFYVPPEQFLEELRDRRLSAPGA